MINEFTRSKTRDYWECFTRTIASTSLHEGIIELITLWNSFTQSDKEMVRQELAKYYEKNTNNETDSLLLYCALYRTKSSRTLKIETITDMIDILEKYNTRTELNLTQNTNLLLLYLMMRGNAHRSHHHFDEAAKDYSECIQIQPQLAIVFNNRALMYVEMGDYTSAIQDYTQALQLNYSWYALYHRGDAHAALGDYDAAIADYTAGIALNPTYSQMYVNRGVSYSINGEQEKALNDFSVAIQLDSTNAAAYCNRGSTFDELGQHEKAIADFTQAILIDDSFASAYYNRASIYTQLQKTINALIDSKHALLLNPTDFDYQLSHYEISSILVASNYCPLMSESDD
jgi:tetratricopeptide (TPR) repeat protein